MYCCIGWFVEQLLETWYQICQPHMGLWYQKPVFQTGVNNCIPHYSVGCNYLSLPEIPASGTIGTQYIQKIIPSLHSMLWFVKAWHRLLYVYLSGFLAPAVKLSWYLQHCPFQTTMFIWRYGEGRSHWSTSLLINYGGIIPYCYMKLFIFLYYSFFLNRIQTM